MLNQGVHITFFRLLSHFWHSYIPIYGPECFMSFNLQVVTWCSMCTSVCTSYMSLICWAIVGTYISQYIGQKVIYNFWHSRVHTVHTVRQCVDTTFFLVRWAIFLCIYSNIWATIFLRVLAIKCAHGAHSARMCARHTFSCLLSHLWYVYISIPRPESFRKVWHSS